MCLKVPFEARDLPSLVRKIMTSPFPRVPSSYSRDVTGLLAKLLAKDPKVCTLRPVATTAAAFSRCCGCVHALGVWLCVWLCVCVCGPSAAPPSTRC